MGSFLADNRFLNSLRTDASSGIGLLALRLAVGTVFINHGYQKLADADKFAGFFEKIGLPAPGFMVILAGLAEFVGGIALVFGLGTRVAAALHVVVMLVAIFVAKGVSALGPIEFDLVLLAASMLFVLGGAGKYSLDRKCCAPSAAAMPAAARM